MVKMREKVVLILVGGITLVFAWRGIKASNSDSYDKQHYETGIKIAGHGINNVGKAESEQQSCAEYKAQKKQLEALLIKHHSDFIKSVEGDVRTGVKLGSGGGFGLGLVKLGARLRDGKDVTKEELAFMERFFREEFRKTKEVAIQDLIIRKSLTQSDKLFNGLDGFIEELREVCSYLPKSRKQEPVSFKEMKYILHHYNCNRSGNDPNVTCPKDVVKYAERLSSDLYARLAVLNLITTYLQDRKLLHHFIQ